MKIILTVLTLTFYSNLLISQEITKSVYFKSDKHILSKDAKTTLNQIIDTLSKSQIDSITLSGHTDNLASADYNKTLSEKRVLEVYNHLLEQNFPKNILSKNYYGELKPVDNNTTIIGRKNNRRVDITIFYKPKIYLAPIPPADSASIKDTCEGDTTIVLEQGSIMVIDKCTFLDKKNCISVIEYTNGESVRNSNLRTTTASGSPLISGGMFELKTCDGNCLNTDVKILIPVRQNCSGEYAMQQWDVNPDGTWGSPKELNTVTIEGKLYYEFIVNCPGKKNADVPAPKLRKVKVKAKNKLELIDVRISFDCPVAQYSLAEKSWRKNIKKFRIPCPQSETHIYALAKTKNGDIVEMSYREHHEVEAKEFIGKCKKEDKIKTLLWAIKVKDKKLFRKYILYKTDFLMQTVDK